MEENDKEVKEKNPNWKRFDNENYTTVTMRVERDFSTKIKNAARSQQKTITQWIIDLINKELNGIKEDPSRNTALKDEFNKINDKLDTTINLISKL